MLLEIPDDLKLTFDKSIEPGTHKMPKCLSFVQLSYPLAHKVMAHGQKRSGLLLS